MDRQAAVKIIRDTFEKPFEKGQYLHFIRNFFNIIDDTKQFGPLNKQYIKDSFKDGIKQYERIGTYITPENKKIDLMIVYLERESSLYKARTMQRNFIADYLKQRGEKEAGVVAFVPPEKEDWRFSFVKMEYKLAQTKSGRVKAKEELTPARRYSFLVGKNEPNHTAQQQLVPLLQDDINNPILTRLEEAFSIEKVTKDFFKEYRKLYHQLREAVDEIAKKDKNVREEFTKKNVDTVDFSKKLLGQIVFLYFIQKKGWLGVEKDKNTGKLNNWGTGPKDFLRRLFNRAKTEHKNFFNDCLEPLFYEVLAIDRGEESYYSPFDCRIPFLNGGLFEPINNYDWAQTDIKIPNGLFSNDEKMKEGDIGTGILDVFDRYNFTVKEDEPLEKEVAIDPEMLGKVFENLLEIKDRKSKGSYYTPREIVHYMCQESLINYLATELSPSRIDSEAKQALPTKEDIETLIHFGDFVIEHDIAKEKGTKTYRHKLPENIRHNANLIDEKLVNIKICDPAIGSSAFPVSMMTEIVRVRNVLTTYLTDKKGRTIYNFKRHAIQNCLYGVDIDLSAVEIAKLRLWLSLIVDEEDIKQIKPLPNLDYKIVQGNSLLSVEKNLFNLDLFNKLEELKPLFFNETNARKKQEYKNQIDKLISQITNGHKEFDFEVYFSEVFHKKKGFDVVVANPPYGETIKNNKDYFKNNFCCSEGKFEIYKFFIEKGLKLLCNKGTLSYITPDTWLRLNYFKKLREFIIKNFNLYKLSKSLYEVFEAVTVDTVISFIQKDKNSENFILVGSDLKTENLISKNIHQEQYIISADEKNLVISKLDNLQNRLSSVCDVTQGLIAYHSKKQKRIWTSRERKTKLHRKILCGGDIGKFYIKWSGDYLKYGSWLHRKRPDYVFDNEKILIQRIRNPRLSDRIIATYDCDRYLNTNGLSNILNLESPKFPVFLKFILAILNSKLINYWFSFYYKDVNIKPAQLRTIPVPKILKEDQLPIVKIVDKIIALTKTDDYINNSTKQYKVEEYEHQIDQMVYKLYGLTDEEIEIVENFNSKKY